MPVLVPRRTGHGPRTVAEGTSSERDAIAGLGPARVGVLAVVRAPGTPWWNVRVTVAHADGPVSGWTPVLFDDAGAATDWVAARSVHQLRPAVRSCADGASAHAAVLDEAGTELLVSAPVARTKAAGVAALLAAELRACTR